MKKMKKMKKMKMEVKGSDVSDVSPVAMFLKNAVSSTPCHTWSLLSSKTIS